MVLNIFKRSVYTTKEGEEGGSSMRTIDVQQWLKHITQEK